MRKNDPSNYVTLAIKEKNENVFFVVCRDSVDLGKLISLLPKDTDFLVGRMAEKKTKPRLKEEKVAKKRGRPANKKDKKTA